MEDLAGLLWVVAGALMAAGAGKIVRPQSTAPLLAWLRVPAPLLATRALGIAEIVIGTAVIVWGQALAHALLAAAYLVFSVLTGVLLARPDTVSCGCFGHDDTPPTRLHLVFNATAAALGVLATLDPVRPASLNLTNTEWALLATLSVLGTVISVLALTRLARLVALVNGTIRPVQTFRIDPHLESAS